MGINFTWDMIHTKNYRKGYKAENAKYWWWNGLSTRHCFVIIVQSLSRVWLLVTPWTAARQASLSFTISQSLLKLMAIESVMPSNHLILCCHLLLLSSIFPRIWIFSSELAFPIRWPKFWRPWPNYLTRHYRWKLKLVQLLWKTV